MPSVGSWYFNRYFSVRRSHFPFIQQEDIPNTVLTAYFRKEFEETQTAFFRNGTTFVINERSDYYVCCFYNSLKFLKPNGYLAAITSNAWLGKNYGGQFKQFLLDNFTINYIVRSNAEHWFTNSQVSTVYIVLQQGQQTAQTRFVTLNVKLDDYFKDDTTTESLQKIEDLYTEIDSCNDPANSDWQVDNSYPSVFDKTDGSVRVSLVTRQHLLNSLTTQENWATYFIAENPLSIFASKVINPSKAVFTNGRGTRTGQDRMHILTDKQAKAAGIESDFLVPTLQSSRHVSAMLHSDQPTTFLFVCNEPEATLKQRYPGAYRWVKKWETGTNNKGILLPEVFKKRRPYWYSLTPEAPANIFISINPDRKLFFSYSPTPITLNQRLVAIRTPPADAPIVTALLNCVVSLLIVELNGLSRNLGALDLNADFFKTKMRILNPALLSATDKQKILTAFTPVSARPVQSYETEFSQPDRIRFDKAVLTAFGYKPDLVVALYELLTETINNRVELKNR